MAPDGRVVCNCLPQFYGAQCNTQGLPVLPCIRGVQHVACVE
jgi:hypothetical protein